MHTTNEPELSHRDFETIEGAGIFALLCSGIDEAKNNQYRYGYDFPKKVGKKFRVVISDFGE